MADAAEGPQTFDAAPAEKPHWAGHRERLRQRFLEGGAGALQPYEILELLLFAALPRRDVKPLAKQLIATFGSLGGVFTASPAQLAARGGLSDNTIATLKIVQAAAEAMLREEASDKPVLSSWADVLAYLRVAMGFEAREQVRTLFLDKKNRLLHDETPQQGTVDQAPLYPREIARRAIELGASAVILAHNHPSGDPTPSQADIATTKDVAAALGVLGIVLHDHIVVGRTRTASFRRLGLL
jgi:DNA repair protein RadC